MYEDSIRVPFIIRDPRQPAALRGRRSDEMVLNIDIAPTILDLAGLSVPDEMQGKSLTPLLGDQSVDWRKDWYYEHTYNTRPPRSPIAKTEGVRTSRWKYIRYPETKPLYEQLFDLQMDPLEQTNLASEAEYADVISRLRNRCDEFRGQLR
jgi:arylsulfatase A-like enzyme